MVGYAVTARIRASEQPADEVSYPKVWEEFAKTPKPWVIVIEDLDYPNPVGSYWGEVNASTYAALGAVGTVTNGGVRDLPEVRATGFHFFSSCLLVSHAYVHVVEAGTPVTVGGLTVHPGDLLHGDEHGVTSIPLGNRPRSTGRLPRDRDRGTRADRLRAFGGGNSGGPGADVREGGLGEHRVFLTQPWQVSKGQHARGSGEGDLLSIMREQRQEIFDRACNDPDVAIGRVAAD